MKNVDVIYPGAILAPNGASTVVRLLYDYRGKFSEEGINCNFNSIDVIDNKINSANLLKEKSDKSSIPLKRRIKKFAKGALYKCLPDGVLLDFIRIYFSFIIGSQKFVKKFCAKNSSVSNDGVFIHDIFTCYYYLKYRKDDNRPILLVLHNNGETFKMLTYYYPRIKDSWVMRKFDRIEKRVLAGIDKLVFVSNNSSKVFIANHPDFPKSRVHFVHNGIPDKIGIDKVKMSSIYEICCVASITDRKGQEVIIDALGKLSDEQRSKLHITFVGDGYLRAHLEKKAELLGISDSVKFVGNQTDVDSFLAKSDIFILPSFDEGLPMAIIEAQRAKLPIVSTYVAGIPEMIEHQRSGLLFNPNVEELTKIFENIDAYNWEEMGKRSYEIFQEKFTVDQMIHNYATLLSELTD